MRYSLFPELLFAAIVCQSCLCLSLRQKNIRNKSDTKLVIDHDGGADDAMALFMALLYEQYFDGPKVVGLTTGHGNVNESQTFYNTQRILDVANRRHVPIYRGSDSSIIANSETDHYFGYDGLGDNGNAQFDSIQAHKNHASVALVNLSKKYEGKLIVIAIGALTNIALAIRLDPKFIGRLKQLYVGAGHVYSKDYSKPEFNAVADVEAYYILAASSIPQKVTFIPYSQVLKTLPLPKEWRIEVLGRIPTATMREQNNFERVSIKSSSNWSLLDPSVVAIVLNSSIAESTRLSKNSIVLCGVERGINTNNFTSEEPNVKMIFSANLDNYKHFLFDIFTSELYCT